MPVEYLIPSTEDRAVELLTLLAVRDQAVREAAEIVQAAYREVAGG
jgi:hypothetical protein